MIFFYASTNRLPVCCRILSMNAEKKDEELFAFFISLNLKSGFQANRK